MTLVGFQMNDHDAACSTLSFFDVFGPYIQFLGSQWWRLISWDGRDNANFQLMGFICLAGSTRNYGKSHLLGHGCCCPGCGWQQLCSSLSSWLVRGCCWWEACTLSGWRHKCSVLKKSSSGHLLPGGLHCGKLFGQSFWADTVWVWIQVAVGGGKYMGRLLSSWLGCFFHPLLWGGGLLDCPLHLLPPVDHHSWRPPDCTPC